MIGGARGLFETASSVAPNREEAFDACWAALRLEPG
jgi:hypothetical protein